MSPRTTAPARRRARSFRLGETEERPSAWRRYGAVVVALIVVAAVFAVAGYLVGRPSAADRMAADIRAGDAARDQRQITELTDVARATRDQLAPVLKGMAQPSVTAAAVTGWQRIVDAAAKSFADPPSGSTATNVARGSLATAVDQLDVAVHAYQQSLAGGPALRELADDQRDLAVRTWSVGATQLDQINVDAGHGHQHVHLEADPDSGAFTPDGEPEGHGHR